MGIIRYGDRRISVNDTAAFHLDAVIAELNGQPFQLHLTLGGENDWDLISLSIGTAPLIIQYANSPTLNLNYTAVMNAVTAARSGKFVSLTSLSKGDNSMID